MPATDHMWSRLSRTDIAVSLVGAVMPWLTGFLEDIPWTYRIPAMVLTACGLLWLWRHLSLRRMMVPHRLQKHYEDDLLYVGELFEGRATISNVTFRRTELKGPGAVYLEGNCRMARPLYNPHFEILAVVATHNTSLLPFYRFRNCVFDDCVFTGVGLLVDGTNAHLYPVSQIGQGQLPLPTQGATQEQRPALPTDIVE